MYKRVCVIGTAQALGLRSQIEDGVNGILTQGDPRCAKNVAHSLAHVLSDDCARRAMAINAQARVVESGLMFKQGEQWMDLTLKLKAAKG